MTSISHPAFLLLKEIDETLGDSSDWYCSLPEEAPLLQELVDAEFLEYSYNDDSCQYRLTAPGWEKIGNK